MKKELSKQQADDILKILDRMVEQGSWASSAFLQVIGKRLRTIRDDFAARVTAGRVDKTKITSHLANRVAARSGQQEVFISLYSSDGGNLQSWERIMLNLPKQLISRPVYASEEDLNQALRAKENKMNEAYVSAYVTQTDILPMADKTPVDRFGKPLLTLKNKSLSLDNVNRFVHTTGIYQYVDGRLVRDASEER